MNLYRITEFNDEVWNLNHTGVLLMLLSVVIELTAEAPYVVAELHLWTRLRVSIDAAMHVCRLAMVAAVVVVVPEYTVIG